MIDLATLPATPTTPSGAHGLLTTMAVPTAHVPAAAAPSFRAVLASRGQPASPDVAMASAEPLIGGLAGGTANTAHATSGANPAPTAAPVNLPTAPADGKLPVPGNPLPVASTPIARAITRPRTAATSEDTADDPTVDQPAGATPTADPGVTALPVPGAVGASIAMPAGATGASVTGPGNGAPSQSLTATPAAADPVAALVTDPARVDPAQIAIAPTAAAPPGVIAGVAAVALTVTLPAVLPVSLTGAGASTVSRLARQTGAPRGLDPVRPTTDQASPTAAAPGQLPATPVPTGLAVEPATPAPPAPQDFAALVDRLLEARATAQTGAAPQQITTTITHADFGKVSLTFLPEPAGLAVSMTSADPGFAPAAQSAMTLSGPAGRDPIATTDRLSGMGLDTGAPADAQVLSNVPASAGNTGHASGSAATGGGSAQSQAHAQSQAQSPPRPSVIATNRSPVAADDRADGGMATGSGIFA